MPRTYKKDDNDDDNILLLDEDGDRDDDDDDDDNDDVDEEDYQDDDDVDQDEDKEDDDEDEYQETKAPPARPALRLKLTLRGEQTRVLTSPPTATTSGRPSRSAARKAQETLRQQQAFLNSALDAEEETTVGPPATQRRPSDNALRGTGEAETGKRRRTPATSTSTSTSAALSAAAAAAASSSSSSSRKSTAKRKAPEPQSMKLVLPTRAASRGRGRGRGVQQKQTRSSTTSTTTASAVRHAEPYRDADEADEEYVDEEQEEAVGDEDDPEEDDDVELVSAPRKRPRLNGVPFKAPTWAAKLAPRRRRWKSYKQILALDSARALDVLVPTWENTKSPPSLLPKKKYCDLTGFPTTYTEPKSGVNFYSAPQYHAVQAMPTDHVQRLLALRRANTRI